METIPDETIVGGIAFRDGHGYRWIVVAEDGNERYAVNREDGQGAGIAVRCGYGSADFYAKRDGDMFLMSCDTELVVKNDSWQNS